MTKQPLVMHVEHVCVVGGKLGQSITRTNGAKDYKIVEWADVVEFLKEYHGAWEGTEEAMYRFKNLIYASAHLRCYFNWIEAGKPAGVEQYCKLVVGWIIDEREAYKHKQFMTRHAINEFSLETTLELNNGQRFERA